MSEVIGPILLQRQCDGGKGDMTEEEWASVIADRLTNGIHFFPGCGTYFQWWWGCNPECPSCGRRYACTLEHIKRYRVYLKTLYCETGKVGGKDSHESPD